MDDYFLDELRKLLNHLYDPDYLSRSQIAGLFDSGGSFDRIPRLQRLMEGAIAALKPTADSPPGSKAWMIYKFLTYRYLQQLDQKKIADQLSVSRTQFFRLQQSALAALAAYLWEIYDLGKRWTPAQDQSHGESLPDAGLERLPDEQADLASVLTELDPLIAALLKTRGSVLQVVIPPDLPPAALSPMVMRQLLLTLVNVALECQASGELHLVAGQEGTSLWIRAQSNEALRLVQESLTPLNELAGMIGTKITLECNAITLKLPATISIPVLVVEDNPDQAQIFMRLLEGTRYQAHLCANPADVAGTAMQTGAKVIILDVMMPKMDGWTVLQNLRNRQETYSIPVVVSTILPVGRLASSLSADAFLVKPVRREELLALLDRLTAFQVKGPDPAPPQHEPNPDR
jgi:CheY-like chemotaxis protein